MIWLRSAGQHDSKAKSIAKFPIIFANFKWVLITKFSLLQKKYAFVSKLEILVLNNLKKDAEGKYKCVYGVKV